MARIIERRYENWAGQRFDDSTLAPSETAEALMAYLDCECTYFPSMADDDPIMCAFEYAGKNYGFKWTRVLARCDRSG